MSVTALNPFLSVADIAEQLSTDAVSVRRIAARGVLKAHYGPEAYPELKIRPADFEAWFVKTPFDLDGPKISHGWFDEKHNAHVAGEFARLLNAALKEYVDSIEEHPTNSSGKPVLQVTTATSPAIRKVLAMQLPKIGGVLKETSRGANRAEEFAIHAIRSFALGIIRREYAGREVSDGINPMSEIEHLYKSRDQYKEIASKAFKMFEGQPAVICSRTWPTLTRANGSPISVTFSVRNRAIGLSESKLVDMAF